MAAKKLISRDEILGGGLRGRPTKQAGTLLSLIENRTAHLTTQSRQAMELYLTDEAAAERNLAFLEAIALDQDLPLRPTIQDLEQFAAQWAYLVAENPRVRAAVAHLLGQRYDFTHQAVPELRAALGLDQAAVQQAYQRLYSEPLESIYTTQVKPIDRLRWAWAGLGRWSEKLSPFWTAFALTLTETVGAGILALPIALAQVGPLAGVGLLVVLGLVNILTIAFMAEAVTRSGVIRYGSAFTGRVVADYLGHAAVFMFAIALFIDCFLFLLVYYIGFSTTLADVTPIPAAVWIGLLFLAGLYVVRRESLDATVASALVIGAINIGMILVLSLLAFMHVQPVRLLYVNLPLLNGRPFEPSLLKLVFGVVLVAYYGHLSVSNCARVVLRRDPSGRSLIWGVIAAQATALALYCIWVLAVNGAISPQVLARESGTVLIPLAAQIGPIVHVFGTVFVVLGIGMASIHFSLGLFNLTREWLPAKPRRAVNLPRRRGQLLFHTPGQEGRVSHHGQRSSSALRLGITYLGLVADQPQFRVDVQVGGATHYVEMASSDRWEASSLFDRLPALRQYNPRLALEIQAADPEQVRLRIVSTLKLTYSGAWDPVGLSATGALTLPDEQRRLINWMRRQEMKGTGTVSLAEVMTFTGQTRTMAHTMLQGLVSQGYIRELEVDSQTHYQPRLAPIQRVRRLSDDIQQALDKRFGRPVKGEPGTRFGKETGFLQRLGEIIVGRRGRFLLSIMPMALVFLLTEWFVLSGRESFTESLNFLGAIIAPLLAGIFPVLLLAASRRKSEITPGVVYRLLGHPLLLSGIYLLSLASLFVHGLLIWEDPAQRAAALVVGVVMVAVTIIMARQGAFARRMVVELRDNQAEGKPASFALTTGGQPTPVEVQLGYLDGEKSIQAATAEIPRFSMLDYANFQLPATEARGLKVWAHRITPAGDSVGLPAVATLHCGDDKQEIDMKLSGGQVTLPLPDEPCRLEIRLRPE